MNRTSGLLTTLFVVFSLLAVAGEVQIFPANGVDLSAYRTYKMLPTRVLSGSGVLENDPEISPLINAALRRELNQKGLTEVAEHADLEVSAGGLVASIPHVEALIFNPTMDADWGTSPLTTIGRYNKEGTLIVNLIDPRSKRSIWLGVAKRALGKPSNLKKDVEKAAQALFRKYPSLN